MPIHVRQGSPTILLRRAAFARANLTRAALDARLGLTSDEFNVEGDLISVGPITEPDAMTMVIAELEQLGLQYFDDFFELSGNWPAWIAMYARAAEERNG